MIEFANRPTLAPLAPVGVFDDHERSLFQKYTVSATFVDKIMGGVPQKPEIIESWLRQRVIGGDEELRLMLLKTLEELDYDIPAEATHEEMMEAIKAVASKRNGNTFRRIEETGELCIADYQIKASLKECTNILFAGDRWGITKKGPKSFLAERVFVDEARIGLGRQEPDGTHLQVGQITGPKGPRSTLTYYDYCVQPSITFTVSSLNDCIKPEHWRDIFLLMQKGGVGALRSLGYGQLKITTFDKQS